MISKLGVNTPALSSHSCQLRISTTLAPIDNTNTLKILGITFNKKYNWADHVASLVSSLSNRLNIIKCISRPGDFPFCFDRAILSSREVIGESIFNALVEGW